MYILFNIILLVMQTHKLYCIDDNLFVIKYFENRKITNIVGFTCDDEQSKINSVKMFNNNNKVVQLYDLSLKSISSLSVIKNSMCRIGIFIDQKCQNKILLKHLFAESTTFYLYSTVYKWLIITTDLNSVVTNLNDTNFTMETDMIIAVSNLGEYDLYEAYNPCKYRGGKLTINKIGKWNSVEFNGSFYDRNVSRIYNYGGMTLKMAGLIVYRPQNVDIVNYLQAYKNISKDSMTKFMYSIALHFADVFNFTIETGEYREWKINDDVGPVVKGLHYRSIDIGGSPTIMTETRAKYVDFLYPIWPFRTFFLFRSTSTSHIRLKEFLMPFTMDCWYYTSFLTVVAIIVFGIVLVFENLDKIEAYEIGFIIAIGSLCQQGSAYIPAKTPGRIAFLNIMLFSLLIYNYYSASVVSTRLDTPLDKMNDSLVELAKSDLKLGAEPSLFFNFILNQSEWEVETFYHKRWKKIPEKDRFFFPEEGIRKVRAGGFAYHTTPEAGYPLVEQTFDNRKICELTEVHICRPSYLYLNTRINSPFTEMLRLGSVKMLERGLLRRQIKRWQTRTPECRRDILSADSITMNEVAPSFFLLMFGVLLSLIIYIIEKIMYYKYVKDEPKLIGKYNINLKMFKELWLKNNVFK